MSSNSPFGANPTPDDRFTEDSPYNPYLGYGQSKLEAEQLVQRSHDRGDLATVIVRPPWFYGPFQPARQTQFFARGAARAASRSSATARNRRSMVYTGNLVHGLLRAEVRRRRARARVLDRRRRALRAARGARRPCATRSTPRGSRCRGASRALPATSPASSPTHVDALLQAAGRYVQALHVLGELKDTIACDISRARAELGYEPAVGLLDGMRASIRWCLERGERDLMATFDPRHRRERLLRRRPRRAAPSRAGDRVRIFDLNPPAATAAGVEYVQGDVRDRDAVRAACDGVDVVLHNVAQVPLAKDRELFWSVNVVGTANVLVAARDAGVGKVVHTSSSAVFGIPDAQPGHRGDAPPSARGLRPGQARGRGAVPRGGRVGPRRHDHPAPHDPRPRPARDHGDPVRVRRRRGAGVRARRRRQPLPVRPRRRPRRRVPAGRRPRRVRPCTTSARRSSGRCARRCRRSSTTPAPARRCARCRSAPARGGDAASLATLGVAPFAPYHWLLYGESLWFDMTRARTELDWEPAHSNASMLIESYEWFLAHRHELESANRSHHQSPVRPGLLRLLKRLP